MNFLAHAFLAQPGHDGVVGALLGDFVKGPIDDRFRPSLASAIALHRRIDSFTDAHPITRRSRNRISPPRRRYAGIIIDMFYDHLLARRWSEHSSEPLEQFARHVYASMTAEHAALPERLQRMLPVMIEEDWLTNYREVAVIDRALDRIGRRLRRGSPMSGAIEELHANEAGLEEDFRIFFPDLALYARTAGTRVDHGEVE